MGGYINLVGKLAIAQVVAVVLAKTVDTVMTKAPRDVNETHGFPKPIFDELNCLAWGGNRAAYMSCLDTLGAPNDISFRMKLWSLLDGK